MGNSFFWLTALVGLVCAVVGWVTCHFWGWRAPEELVVRRIVEESSAETTADVVADDVDAETVADVMVADASNHEGVPPARRLYGNRPWLTLTLLALLTGSASAGVGWLMRTRIGPPSQAKPKVDPLPTAEAQFVHAMFLVNNEEAWKAVGKYYANDAAEKVWVQRAEEQLLLFYLKDKSRERESLDQIKVLAAMKYDGKRFYSESRVAEAYVAAGARDTNKAKSILSTDRAQFEAELKGPWRKLFLDLQYQVTGPPPGGGPRPGEDDRRGPPPGEER